MVNTMTPHKTVTDDYIVRNKTAINEINRTLCLCLPLCLWRMAMCGAFPAYAGSQCAYPRKNGQAELAFVSGDVPRR